MSTLALPQVDVATSAGPPKKRMSPWQMWGLVLLAPYVLVFLVFVLYPVGYGLARTPSAKLC
jgi:multiple sugar transport system permease protein